MSSVDDTEQPISRAVNVSMEEPQVLTLCKKHDVVISAIEALPAGGTRVVFMNEVDAAKMIKLFKSKVMTGSVQRTHWIRGV